MEWKRRLIAPDEMVERTADWPVYGGTREDGSIHLLCGECDQSLARLSQGGAFLIRAGELLPAILRHEVMAHDEPLGRRPAGPPAGGPGDPGGPDSGGGGRSAGDRPRHQKSDRGRVTAATGGDRT